MYADSMVDRVLLTEEQIKEKTAELGKAISDTYGDEEVVVVTLLKGGAVFATDLIRAISSPVKIDFMCVSSYGDASKTSGIVKVVKDLDVSIKDKNVLIAEDIIDSGLTLSYVSKLLKTRNPKSLRICTILDKPSRRISDVNVDFVGFEIPDEYVVGYGLDFHQLGRNLPYVGVVKRELYED